MKNTASIFLFPFLVIACALFAYVTGNGMVMLLMLLFGNICAPIIHFTLVSGYIKSSESSGTRKLTAVMLSFVELIVSAAFSSVIMFGGSRMFYSHLFFSIGWAVACGIVIVCHTALVYDSKNKLTFKVAVVCEAFVVLSTNAFLTYLISPSIAVKSAIDGVEIVLLLVCAIILSMYSYFLGKITKKHFFKAKSACWLAGILLSEFIVMWLLGTPHTPPTATFPSLFVWIAVSLMIFGWFIFGYAKKHSSEDKQSAKASA